MDPQFVRRELERILASAAFAGADRSSRFLRFVVEHSLDGKNVEIKESTIAVGLFDRKPAFDPRTDPIVRAEAARLRTRLDAYYRLEGCSDPVRISVPKGGYTPEFSVQAAEEAPRAPRAPLLLIFVAFLALAAVAV